MQFAMQHIIQFSMIFMIFFLQAVSSIEKSIMIHLIHMYKHNLQLTHSLL